MKKSGKKGRTILLWSILALAAYFTLGIVIVFSDYKDSDLVLFSYISFFAFSFFIFVLSVFNSQQKVLALAYRSDIDNGEISKKHSGLLSQINEAVCYLQHRTVRTLGFISDIANGKKLQDLSVDDGDEALHDILKKISHTLNLFSDKEELQKWHNKGLSLVSTLISEFASNFDVLTEQTIKQLVKFCQCHQGGLFITERDEKGDQYLILKSDIAFNREKKEIGRIYEGEGLLGQSLAKKEMIYIDNLPKEYASIKSGLGDSAPKYLAIIPLIFNKAVYGVIELTSFKPIDINKREFLLDAGKNLASAISVYKKNIETEELLKRSQALTEELKANEENLMQSMEELATTQEEMERKQTELDGIITAIDSTLGTADLDTNGNIITINRIFSEILELPGKEVNGYNFSQLLSKNQEVDTVSFCLREGRFINQDFEIKIGSKIRKWINASISPVKNSDGKVTKFLILARDITDKKMEEKQIERLSMVADNTDNAVIITDPDGKVEYVNRGFHILTGYDSRDIMGKKPGELLQGPDTDQETKQRIHKLLKKQEPVKEEILNYNKDGESYWVSLMINPVFDLDCNLKNYVGIQSNITQTKKNAIELDAKIKAISNSNAIVEIGEGFEILNANENFLEIFGEHADNIVGRNYRSFKKSDPDFLNELENIWHKLSKGEHVETESKWTTIKGKNYWLKESFNPIFDIKNRLVRVIDFVVDITLEKQFQIEKKKQQKELDSHLDAINNTIASVEFTLDGRVKNANSIYLGVSEYKLEDIVGQKYEFLIPEGEAHKPQTKMMWDNLVQGRFFSGEFKHIDKLGREIWLSGTFNPIFDLQGMPYKVMMYAQFITKEKERQLELNGMVNTMKFNFPVLTIDENQNLLNGNSRFMELFQLKRLELKKLKFKDLLAETTCQKELDVFFGQLKEQEHLNKEFEFTISGGHSSPFRANFGVIKDLENKIRKIIVVLDKSELKEKIDQNYFG